MNNNVICTHCHKGKPVCRINLDSYGENHRQRVTQRKFKFICNYCSKECFCDFSNWQTLCADTIRQKTKKI